MMMNVLGTASYIDFIARTQLPGEGLQGFYY